MQEMKESIKSRQIFLSKGTEEESYKSKQSRPT